MMQLSLFSSLQFRLILALLFLSSLNYSCQKNSPGDDSIVEPDSIENLESTFPNARWALHEDISNLGYSKEKINQLNAEVSSSNSAAFLAIYKGKIIFQYGNTTKKYQSHSLRKSFLSALYGNYVKDNYIDLQATLEDLEIDDIDGLSSLEKTATVKDLLMARSGVYHPAAYESETMKNLKPERYSHEPGTFWYYNNWDFNALGTIFMERTGKDIYASIEQELAIPIQMEDFRASDGNYQQENSSIHKAYPFRISANDLARFGLLILNKGKWKDNQVIPENWVNESTKYYSDAALYSSSGYGYMWWVAKNDNQFSLLPETNLPEDSYMAHGVGGQTLLIIPSSELVVVNRVDTDANKSMSLKQIGGLVKTLLQAKTD